MPPFKRVEHLMTRASRNILAGLCTFALSFSMAAAQQPGKKQAAQVKEQKKVFSLESGRRIEVAPLNVPQLIQEDAARLATGGLVRFAIPHQVNMTPSTHGQWTNVDRVTRRWTITIASPDAASINLGFTRYHMPPGGQLVMRSADGTLSVRPFNASDNAPHNELWTPVLHADEIVVEVTLPIEVADQLDLQLGAINIGYRRFSEVNNLPGDTGTPRSGACNIDVACSTADPWQDQVKTVAVYQRNGSWTCTGAMVNNTAQDQTPYFLTAAHCGLNDGNDQTMVVYWNYENSTCRGIPGGGGVGDGSLAQFNSGAIHRATFATSDFTLVEMEEDPDTNWDVHYAGWDRQGLNPPSGACIHHPSTDEKRITLYDIAVRPDRPTHASSWPCTDFPGTGADNTHIKVYWSLGVTEPGSSGSPMFDENKRIIGQLHGGASSCSATGDDISDCYGRVSRSWTGGGTAATRLSDWLDPGNTGALNVDTIGAGFGVAPGGPTLHIGEVGGPFTNNSVVYTLTNPSPSSINFTVALTADFGILLNGSDAPINGTLPGLGGTTNITVTVGSECNSLSAGTYNETINFTDTTNSRTLPRLHTVEVGQTGFTTTPANGLASGGPVGGPFNATQVYTLTSTRPTPVTIQVTANQPWISINGNAGPEDITLTGTGDSDTVTISYAAAANSLAAGLYNGLVTFTNTNGGSGNTNRPVSLDVGRYSYTATDTPKPINDNSTINSVVNITDAYCIGDVNVEINISHTYIGDLIVDLMSPGGTVVRLHNRTGGTAENIVQTYDDGVINPDGPGTLGDFVGENVTGAWTLTVSDNAGADIGTLNSWTLKIASAGANCPTRELVYNYPMNTNPGWTTQGLWAFGVPQGLGGDPASGATGSNVYGYNLSGDYPDNMGSTHYLTTTAIDCTGLTGVQIRFKRWLGVESASYDHANLQISTNGSTWTNVWNHTQTSAINETSWSSQSYAVPAADGQSTVYFRWGMGTTDGSVTYHGWNIDDVELWAIIADPCENVVLADMNADGNLDGLDVNRFSFTVLNPGSATQQEACAADLSGDDQVTIDDVVPFVDELLN